VRACAVGGEGEREEGGEVDEMGGGGGGDRRSLWPHRMRQPSLFSFSLGDASPGGFRTCAPGRRPGRAGTRTHRCAPASAGLFSPPRSQFSTWPAGRRQGGAVPAALPRLLFFTFFLQLLVQVVDVHRLAGRDVAHGGQAGRAAWRAAERLTPAEKKKLGGGLPSRARACVHALWCVACRERGRGGAPSCGGVCVRPRR
jgi:hypothetical protein